MNELNNNLNKKTSINKKKMLLNIFNLKSIYIHFKLIAFSLYFLNEPYFFIQIKDLEDWLNNMTKTVYEKHHDLQSQFMNIQLVYAACFKELIRQVSANCSERGSLIQRIWNDYLEIVEKTIIYERQKNAKIQNEQISEITKIHSLYQTEINNLTSQYNKSIERSEILQHDYEKANNEKKYALKQVALVKKKMAGIQESYLTLRKDYDKLLAENYNLKLIADDNIIPDSPLKLTNKQRNTKVTDLLTPTNRRSSTTTIPFNGTSIVSHLLEVRETQSLFSRKEIIDIHNEKKASQNLVTAPPINPKLNKLATMKGDKESEGDINEDDLEIIELEDVGVDTSDLFERQDKEIMTDFIQIKEKKRDGGGEKELDDDYGSLKESCFFLEEILDLMNFESKQQNEVNIF